MPFKKLLYLFSLVIFCQSQLSAQYIGNLSFDHENSQFSPIGWKINNPGQSCKIDSSDKAHGKYSLKIVGEKPPSYTFCFQDITVQKNLVQTVVLSGYIKTVKTAGSSGLWLRASSSKEVLEFNNMADKAVEGKTDWQQYQIKINIPEDTEELTFGIFNTGVGEAWFDQLELQFNQQNIAIELDSFPTLELDSLDQIKKYIHPLSLENDHQQFSFLDSSFQASKIVALGASSYGAQEVEALKAQIAKHLLSMDQFNLLALESSLPETYEVNNYLKLSDQDLDKALKGLRQWAYNSHELKELLEWMKGKDLNLAGFDMKYYQGAIKALQEIEMNNYRYQKLLTDLSNLLEIKTKLNDDQKIEAQELIESIKNAVKESNAVFDKKYIFKMTDILDQYYHANSDLDRSLYMSENIKWVFNYERQRPILWSHNDHIKEEGNSFGQMISSELGKANYLSIGFAYYEGKYNAVGNRGLNAYEAHTAPKGSYENYFHQVGTTPFAIDLRKIDKDHPLFEWLFSPAYFRDTGASYKSQQFYLTDLAEAYDIIIFIQKVSPTDLNR